MANQCFNQAKAVLEFRLDPCHLPQMTTYFVSKTGNQIICSLNERGVFLKFGASSSLSRLIPAHHFRGIAARIVDTFSGGKAIKLELFHVDEEICIPLLVSRKLNNVFLDWRLWAQIYNLPMLMIDEYNSIIKVQDRSVLHQFFHRVSSYSVQKRFLLRCNDSLGLRLVIDNQTALQ
ncbi:conserved protein of unknown function [Bartonella clarridgeiae 73]|uniref:Uncharacterized protein n=1 Tax=Bartonella clarridgeiae (strain CCUG 45776 / CIP 104772 / 73) TaxID=696125 RepID=E6YGW3_BARC7|nr:DUF6101 family protein [Bartonella clarridgeiae]WCR55311.1 MAG: hypothetical protein PG977_000704 [Bartonella clarridgeiae]CBI76101.1 conserved protein of unknown function [Bartonella clarridgeiae 73]